MGALGAALCHHFAALSAAVIAIWGFFLLEGAQRKHLVWLSLLAFVLYLPHMPITLEQLSRGGVGGVDGWLGAPKPQAWIDYFRYLAQYNWLTLAIGVISLLLSLFRFKYLSRTPRLLVILGVGMHLLMMAIAYFYSIYVNPIFQYSILIFSSLPFLLALFSGWYRAPVVVKGLLVGLLMISCSFAFYTQRQHPAVMAKQPLNEMAKHIAQFNEHDSRPLALFSMNKDYLGVFQELNGIEFDYMMVEKTPLQQLHTQVTGYQGRLVSCLLSLPEFSSMYRDLVSPNASRVLMPTFELLIDDNHLRNPSATALLDSTWLNQSHTLTYEWGRVYTIDLSAYSGLPRLNVDVVQVSEGSALREITLVCELWQEEEKILWLGRDQELYAVCDSNMTHHYLHVDIDQELSSYDREKPLSLRCYMWNRSAIPVEEFTTRIIIEEEVIIRGALQADIPLDYSSTFSQ